MSRAYYNEHDPEAAQWLRNLISEGHIAAGDVDERSIKEVQGSDLDGYAQVHLFAGIGGWSLAFRLAGWPDDQPVWSGSCPCQPFSAAGKRKGVADDRHLWPEMFRLVRERRPGVVFGEQVASKDGLGWLDGVFADLESEDYACGAVDLCAAGVKSPHIRQRLCWVADATGSRHGEHERDARSMGISGEGGEGEECEARRLAQAAGDRGEARGLEHAASDGRNKRGAGADGWSIAGGRWGDFEVLPYHDGKGGIVHRRSQPSSFPLAHGLPRSVGPGSTREQRVVLMAAKANRNGRLKGYGNAIVPQLAAEFITAFKGAA